jgi:D-serine deaminase-like pyridoxal phosphate-dependent protein
MAAGIQKHKCATFAEAEMLADCGVEDILVAYPQVGPAVELFSQLQKRFPKTTFRTTVDASQCAQELSAVAKAAGQRLNVLVDVDIGMHRTGTATSQSVVDLARAITQLEGLSFGGLHAYDGHNHMPSAEKRETAVAELSKPLENLIRELQAASIDVPRVVCGGTPTFPMFAGRATIGGCPVELSPGTCILHDYRYQSHFPDVGNFQYAAILLTRVISKPTAGQFTCDLGHKAIAADPAAGERCLFVDLPDAMEAGHNEEHLVVRSSRADQLKIGELLRVVPTHICPTSALHGEAQVVRDGKLDGSWQVAARHRIYQP